MSVRRKSLLIGINYIGSQHQLSGCINDVENMAGFLMSRGYSDDPRSMVVLTDTREGPYYASGHNILAGMDWLVSEPNTCLFMHYSGHGGQIPDTTGRHSGGYEDTIVPVDFERNGQINSSVLHRHLVSNLSPNSTLFIILDCCHSGSALELPYVYRTDEYGNVNMIDNLKQGFKLFMEAEHLIQGDYGINTRDEATHLYGAATDFFRGLRHQHNGPDGDGLSGADDYNEEWAREGKSVFMFSGCRDEQTSADAYIGGKHVGAMSWAFLTCMTEDYNWDMSYVQILQQSRHLLQQKYSQIPQLSCGYQFDLNMPMRI